MAIRITDETMTLEIDDCVVATARVKRARRGRRRRVDRFDSPGPAVQPQQAITGLTLAERLTVGYGDDDPFVMAWRKELFL